MMVWLTSPVCLCNIYSLASWGNAVVRVIRSRDAAEFTEKARWGYQGV